MPSKFEEMRHRENRRIRESFYQTQRNVQASNQKIRNDYNKFDAMRHRENRKMRNDFGRMGNDFKNIGKTINTGIKSSFK
jgi:archaellum component FlaC